MRAIENPEGLYHFNPRPREEGDKIYDLKAKIWNISIHALVKRATDVSFNASYIERISIHALVKRATFLRCMAIPLTHYFNPRPREEGDVGHTKLGHYQTYFNPRPREEGDLIAVL